MESLPLPPDEPQIQTPLTVVGSRSTATSPTTIHFQGERRSLWSRASPFVLTLLIGALIGGSVVNYAYKRAGIETDFFSVPVRRDHDQPYTVRKKTVEAAPAVKKVSRRSSSKSKPRERKPWLAN